MYCMELNDEYSKTSITDTHNDFIIKNAMNISFHGVTISVIYENHQKVINPLRFLIMNYNDSDENI